MDSQCKRLLAFCVLGLLLSSTAWAAPVFNPSTGHYYERIDQVGLTWDQANQAASSMSYLGTSGYLMTITEATEQQFLADNLTAGYDTVNYNYWVGGLQAVPNGGPSLDWQWITGEIWNFTNWQPNEPNDDLGKEEDALNVVGANNWEWNDAVRSSNYSQGGFLVEYSIPEPTSTALVVMVGYVGVVFVRRR